MEGETKKLLLILQHKEYPIDKEYTPRF